MPTINAVWQQAPQSNTVVSVRGTVPDARRLCETPTLDLDVAIALCRLRGDVVGTERSRSWRVGSHRSLAIHRAR